MDERVPGYYVMGILLLKNKEDTIASNSLFSDHSAFLNFYESTEITSLTFSISHVCIREKMEKS